jgi:arylsulfatase A-like enzyme
MENCKMIVIVYVADSLRPDFLGCYGFHKNTSPNIDKIAEDGVVFDNCFAQSTWTRSSGASILTSTYPSVHKVITINDVLLPKIPTLPTLLKRRFKNIAVSAMGNISPGFGFDLNFDHFVELYKEDTVIKKRVTFENKKFWRSHFKSDFVSIATSEDANEALLPLLEKYIDENVFVMIWSIDTHNPFFHREPELVQFSKEIKPVFWDEDFLHRKIYNKIMRAGMIEQRKLLYEDMIYYNDYYIGVLINRLKKLGQYNRALFIITSDHGEGFGEHGQLAHAGIPYDEQIRVPLIIKFPMAKNRQRIGSLVQHIDIMPTILEYLGLERNDMAQGKSLIQLISGRKKRINNITFSETKLSNNFPKYISLRTDNYKYIKIENPELKFGWSLRDLRSLVRLTIKGKETDKLFFVKKDRAESKNLIGCQPDKVEEFRTILNSFFENNRNISSKLGIEGRTGTIEEATRRQLKMLGYID